MSQGACCGHAYLLIWPHGHTATPFGAVNVVSTMLPGVPRFRGFKHNNLRLSVCHRAMLDTTGNDAELASLQNHMCQLQLRTERRSEAAV